VNKLRKTQRYPIAGILIVTPVLIAFLWLFGVRAEQSKIEAIQNKTIVARDQLKRSDALRRQIKEINDKMNERARALTRREAILAPDWDAYDWIMRTINSLGHAHRGVRIDSYSQPEISSTGLLPDFPYNWATFHVSGAGYYQDFGSFFADLENTFRYFRIQNIDITPNTKPGAQAETLIFNFDLVTPVVASETK
jgi:Tfp pilus assembly protein PilO